MPPQKILKARLETGLGRLVPAPAEKRFLFSNRRLPAEERITSLISLFAKERKQI